MSYQTLWPRLLQQLKRSAHIIATTSVSRLKPLPRLLKLQLHQGEWLLLLRRAHPDCKVAPSQHRGNSLLSACVPQKQIFDNLKKFWNLRHENITPRSGLAKLSNLNGPNLLERRIQGPAIQGSCHDQHEKSTNNQATWPWEASALEATPYSTAITTTAIAPVLTLEMASWNILHLLQSAGRSSFRRQLNSKARV